MADNSDVKIIYVLLDGVGDLPHPDIDNKTQLEAAQTPNLDKLALNAKNNSSRSIVCASTFLKFFTNHS